MSKIVIRKADSIKSVIHGRSVGRRRHLKSGTSLADLPAPRGAEDISLVHVPTARLKPLDRRVRRSDPQQIKAVGRSISAFGCMPIIIDQNYSIINGVIVWQAAEALGVKVIPCVRIERIGSEQARLLAIALNRLAETGSWDDEGLRLELLDLKELELDLTLTGLTSLELDGALQSDVALDGQTGSDELPQPSSAIVSQLGDLWILGNHRLLCGDACAASSYEQLCGTEKIDVTITDPPFNCAIEGFVSGKGKIKHGNFIQGSGELTDEQFHKEFLRPMLVACKAQGKMGMPMFIFMDWRMNHILVGAALATGLRHLQTIVWYKGSGGLGGTYRNAHEFVNLFCTSKTLATNNVKLGKHGRDRTNVWEYPGANRRGSSAAKALALHGTPKPVELIKDALYDVTERGAAILDPFMGSGTTIIAGEDSERRVFGMELDPKFVDVAIRRWQDYTGLHAIHQFTGLTFDALAAVRADGGHSPHSDTIEMGTLS